MLPDCSGKFTLGKSDSHPLASTGGSETVALTVAQMPAHSHNVTGGNHTHTVQMYSDNRAGGSSGTFIKGTVFPWKEYGNFGPGGAYTSRDVYASALAAAATSNTGHTHTVANSGSGQAHENMPPFLCLNFIIKT